MKEEKNHNAYAYISIVAIVAIVSVFVMFAGSGSKETPQPIVLSSSLGGDLVGDARYSTYTDINKMIYNPLKYGTQKDIRGDGWGYTYFWFDNENGESYLCLYYSSDFTLIQCWKESQVVTIDG